MARLDTAIAALARRAGLGSAVDRIKRARDRRATYTAVADGFSFVATHEQRHHLESITTAEPLTVDRFTRSLQPGMTVIDVGAFLAHFTLVAAQTVGPTGQVISLEANHRNHRSVARNVRDNGFDDRVEVIFGAAAAADGPITFFDDPRDPAQHSLVPRLAEQATPVEVRGHRLDSLTDTADVIKSDAEGAEMEVLDGMPRLLESRPELFFEMNPAGLRRAGHEPRGLGERMVALGYRVTVINERTGTTHAWDDDWSVDFDSLNLHAQAH